MKVFYTASYYGKQKYQQHYDMVLKAIESTGVELISPEKGNYKKLLTRRNIERLKKDRRIHYEAIRKGIIWADAVIIEISNEDFQLGHEATLAVSVKKHVLCLSIHEDFSEKINHQYFHGAKYNQFNVEEVVVDFIERAKKERLSERFNCFLSPRQLEYLDKVAAKQSIGMSEYVRLLIDNDRSRG